CLAMNARLAASRSPVAAMRPASDGESTVPGQIALQRTPLPTKSAATDFVNPMTAAFVAPYTQRFGIPLMLEAIEATLTIDPPSRSSMPGRTDLIVRYIEVTLRSNDRAQSSGAHSRIVPWCTNPATFTRMLMPGHRFAMASH